MPRHLRFDRQDPTGWILAEGPLTLGEIQPDRMTFVGFPDAPVVAVLGDPSLRHLEPEPV
ncbi:hypothetical protein [Pseudogemmatithrix spongiicola]|uniref:Uncharacterized protein n=1 Tax=Pseudogemmatithrix spongiicola TaxID=3062599 RepID=A0AA49Q8R9_9BACT|nr:hypothetical protein Strain318_002457 [Gemmatimonadaceae bacterium 'strain 318']